MLQEYFIIGTKNENYSVVLIGLMWVLNKWLNISTWNSAYHIYKTSINGKILLFLKSYDMYRQHKDPNLPKDYQEV